MKQQRFSNSCDGFILFFEEMEKKKMSKSSIVKKTEVKTAVKTKTVSSRTKVQSHLNKILSKFNKDVKKNKKLSKSAKEVKKQELLQQTKRAILGIGLLSVVVSIAYSTTIVREFVDSPESLVILAPQVIFAVKSILKAFSKIYK